MKRIETGFDEIFISILLGCTKKRLNIPSFYGNNSVLHSLMQDKTPDLSTY